VSERLAAIFEKCHRELRPRAPLPRFHIEFFPYANLNSTIRVRCGVVRARISDLLEGAPADVLRSLAHILLAKLYRKPIAPAMALRYRRHASSAALSARTEVLRRTRGRKRMLGARGRFYDLEEVFEDLNGRYCHGLLGRPLMTWSAEAARTALGHYDPAHNTIVVSRVFDSARTPRYAVEYIVFHEMLHLKHPVRMRGARRCFHPPALREEERRFAHLAAAKRFLKRL
jgi:hypothetical protein